MSAIAEAAAFIAQQWPCFPCAASKRPLTEHGFKDAVSDPDAARRLFRSPDAVLIGVPTGEASNLAVIDLDVKAGASGLEWLAANEARLPATRRHRTRSGGLHLLFAYPPGRRIRNSASRIAPGVDVRGEGGYIIVPPSEGYAIATDAMPAAMPAWLVDLIDPPQVVRATTAPMPRRNLASGDGTPYGLAGLDRECAAIRNAPDGGKHDALNRAAYSIGGLVAAGEVVEGAAYAALADALNAIRHRCEDFPAAERTLKTAFRDGMAAPRQPPPPREHRVTIRIETEPPETIPYDDVPPHLAAEPEMVEVCDPETGEFIMVPSASAKPASTKGNDLDIIWFDQITPIRDAKDFVQGVLVEASAAVVYGESNAGKTFWTTDLALHVAAGKEWNGKRVEQGGVIYCVLEGGFGFNNRVAAWRAHHKPEGPVHFGAIQSSLNLLKPDADTPRLIAAVQRAARHINAPVKLIVIDTLARAFAGGNENASEDMGALVLNMDQIRRETGACVLFVHHSGKDKAQGARGHSSLRAALDTEIEVVSDEETGVKTATSVKQRELKKGEAFRFALEVVSIGHNRHQEDVTTCIVAPPEQAALDAMAEADHSRLSPDQQAALRILSDLLAEPGRSQTGGYGLRDDCQHVPEDWWRDRFYRRAKPGATDAAKQKAFRRAADALIEARKVGMDAGRVWIP